MIVQVRFFRDFSFNFLENSFHMGMDQTPNTYYVILIHVLLGSTSCASVLSSQAMRRTMEIYSQTTRFALACNISSKIIEPIQLLGGFLRESGEEPLWGELAFHHFGKPEGTGKKKHGWKGHGQLPRI